MTLSGYDYVYMFNDFNGQMINDISSTTYSITLTNLNKFSSINDLSIRFEEHPLSKGYKLDVNTSSNILNISPQFNNYTAYYNLSSNINLSGDFKTMSYTSGFLNFGYTPTYNLLDYLENLNDKTSLNPTFYANKELYSMPYYKAIPLQGVGNFTSDICYIDYNGITYSSITGNNQPNYFRRTEPDRTLFFRFRSANGRRYDKLQKKINKKRTNMRLRGRNQFHKRKYT